MTDTEWVDISEFQRVVDDSYPYRWIAFRACDGTYRDAHFAANYAWAKSAVARGRLDGFIVYIVYRPGGGEIDTVKAMVGTPHPRMVVMDDVESWGGRIRGDHSAEIDRKMSELDAWLGDSRRAIGYGNRGDLLSIWPTHATGERFIVAAYGSDPVFPGKIAHQYTDSATVAPFGYPVDLNSADGYSSAQLAAAFGLTAQVASVGNPTPVTTTPAVPDEEDIMRFLYCKDNVGALWTLINVATGALHQTRDQKEANLWAQAFGTARTVTADALVAAENIVKAAQAVPAS